MARLLRLDEVTAVAVPTLEQEVARDLVRAREDARGDLMRARHRLSKLLLRHGIVYSGGIAWTGAHDVWLRQHARGRLPSATSQVAFDTCYDAVLMVTARLDHGASGMGVRARVVPAPSVAQFYGRAVARGVSSKTITVNVIGGPMSGLGVPREEARLTVVLNGGVSLAVWMGGPITELDRLMRRIGSGGAPLRRLVCTARTDVKVGTSAGGINGAALALSQVNEYANLSSLRDMWADQRQAAPVPALVGIEVGGRRLRRAGERVARGAHDRTYELNRSDGS